MGYTDMSHANIYLHYAMGENVSSEENEEIMGEEESRKDLEDSTK